MATNKGTRKPLTEAQREAKRAAYRAWYAQNREKRLVYNAQYSVSHAEEIQARQRAHALENAEEIAERNRVYTATHREERRASWRAYEHRHAEKRRAKNAAYAATHREEIRQKRLVYLAANAEKIRRRRAVAYAENRVEAIAKVRLYQKTHPEIKRSIDTRRRARKAAALINDFTAGQWVVMQEHYHHRCVYCGKRAKGRLTQDHITPLVDGGNHTASNIVPACGSCNSRKGPRGVLRPIQPLLMV